MRFSTLQAWLDWQESLNPRAIDLGLERVGRVWRRMGTELAATRITVAGTNGKGSTIAFLEALLEQSGRRTGSYTSPHLLRYNERIRIQGEPVDDATLMAAFDAIDRARGEIPLTYFEFGTLAAFWILARERVEFALLEVGLGGRLDAVNLLDPQVAVITGIDLDHQQWLGTDREAIGREKAGILRPGRPAVYSGRRMPRSIGEIARRLGAPLYVNGDAYRVSLHPDGWSWHGPHRRLEGLPLPALEGEHQLDNAAGALMALDLLDIPLEKDLVTSGLKTVFITGRQQRRVIDGVTWWLDVAHNAQAARALARSLADSPVSGVTHGLLGVLADKEADTLVEALEGQIDHWHLATLDGPRGRSAQALARVVPGSCHSSVAEGVAALRKAVSPGDRVVVLGSFLTVGQALEALTSSRGSPFQEDRALRGR